MHIGFRAATAILVSCVALIIINCQKHGDDAAIENNTKNRGEVSLSFETPTGGLDAATKETSETEEKD